MNEVSMKLLTCNGSLLCFCEATPQGNCWLFSSANRLFSVLQAPDEASLTNLSETLREKAVAHKLWIEQPENIPTCLALKPYPKDAVHTYLRKLKLFKWSGKDGRVAVIHASRRYPYKRATQRYYSALASIVWNICGFFLYRKKWNHAPFWCFSSREATDIAMQWHLWTFGSVIHNFWRKCITSLFSHGGERDFRKCKIINSLKGVYCMFFSMHAKRRGSLSVGYKNNFALYLKVRRWRCSLQSQVTRSINWMQHWGKEGILCSHRPDL